MGHIGSRWLVGPEDLGKMEGEGEEEGKRKRKGGRGKKYHDVEADMSANRNSIY